MQVHNVEQGTEDWLKLRLGVPTSSCFDKIITPTGKPSTQLSAYANKLIAEWLCGEPLDCYENDWMKRGTELEPQARAFYEMVNDAEVRKVGFVTDHGVGCSPDGLVDDGLLEIKCPAPHTHVDYLLTNKVPTKYFPQVQGQMFVTGAAWCDFLSYHELMPPVLIRVERDDKFISTLKKHIEVLLETIIDRKAILSERGINPVKEAA